MIEDRFDAETEHALFLFALHVRGERRSRDISIATLAERAGVDKKTVARLEDNPGAVSIGKLLAIGKALSCDAGQFLSKACSGEFPRPRGGRAQDERQA